MTAIPNASILDQSALNHAVDQLCLRDDACIEQMIAIAGPPPLRKRDAGLEGLIRIIISQQVSTASADAIHKRFSNHFSAATPADLCAAADTHFQACGLSAPKIRTVRHLAHAINSGAIDLDALPSMESDAVRQCLTSVKGIGPWTADVYLLFCLGAPDVWPAGDLALQEGVRLALGLRKRPNADRLEKISKRWRPWRAVAARIIWAYYGACRTAPNPAQKKAKQSKPA